MGRSGKWGIFALLVAATAALAARMVISQQPAGVAFEDYGVIFNKVKPHIEQALSSVLRSTPQFQSVSTRYLVSTPDPDLDAHLRWHFPQLQGETLNRTRQVARHIIANATVAQYVEGTNTIFVTRENLPKIAGWNESLAGVNSEAFLTLAIVHEIIRCHLDQQFQFANLRRACRDAEEWDALQTIIEGRAAALTRAVARRLGTEEVFPLLAKHYLNVPDEAPDPSIKAAAQTALHARYRASLQGEPFFDALAAAGLREPDSRVFTRLPRQMTVLARPNLWLQSLSKNQSDLSTVLQALESALPAADWQPMQQTWTPAMLEQVAVMLGCPKERTDKVARTWYEGRSLIWTNRKRPDRHVALSVVRHADETDGSFAARAYFGFALDLQRKQDTLPPGTCGPTIRVVDSKSAAVRLEGFDEAVRNDKTIALGDTPPIPVNLLLARSGNLVIECTWHGQSADPALAERLVQSVRTAAK